MNENKIVRVRNKKLDRTIRYVATLTGESYQYVFESLCDYFVDGHVYGDYTDTKLIEIVLIRKETE